MILPPYVPTLVSSILKFPQILQHPRTRYKRLLDRVTGRPFTIDSLRGLILHGRKGTMLVREHDAFVRLLLGYGTLTVAELVHVITHTSLVLIDFIPELYF
jgi:hypothetical protein